MMVDSFTPSPKPVPYQGSCMKSIKQQFFNDLEKKLWSAADQLRSNLDAAVYKHVVLGLIFLKYVSDAFEERQQELRRQFTDPAHDYYMDPDAYGGEGTDEYAENLAAELEVRDYYTEKNVFWVPREARWQTLRDCAQLPPKAPLPWNKPGKDDPEEMRSVGWLIDNAMDAVERENPRLKNVLFHFAIESEIINHRNSWSDRWHAQRLALNIWKRHGPCCATPRQPTNCAQRKQCYCRWSWA